MPPVRAATNARVVKILAPLACFWLGLLEVEAAGSSPGVPPDPRRRLAVVPLIPDKRYYGESPASVRRGSGAAPRSFPCRIGGTGGQRLGYSGCQDLHRAGIGGCPDERHG